MTGAFIKSAGLELCSHLKTATENWELPRVYKRHTSVTHPKKMDMDGIGKGWSILVYLVYHFTLNQIYLELLFDFCWLVDITMVTIVLILTTTIDIICQHRRCHPKQQHQQLHPLYVELTPRRCIHVDPTRRWRMVDPCCCATALLLQLHRFFKELGPSHIKWPSLSNFRIPSAAERYTFISSSLVHKDDVGASLVHAQLTLITSFGKLNERIQPNPSKKKDHQNTNNQNMLLESLNMGETLDQDTAHTHFKCHETKLRSWLLSIPQHI